MKCMGYIRSTFHDPIYMKSESIVSFLISTALLEYGGFYIIPIRYKFTEDGALPFSHREDDQ